MHSLYITRGPVSTYKLFVWVYKERSDKDLLETKHQNTATQPLVYYFHGWEFQRASSLCYHDMGDTTTLIGSHKWKVGMIGTAQENQTGTDTAEEKTETKKNSSETVTLRHNSASLCYEIWASSNLIYSLSNFCIPKVVERDYYLMAAMMSTEVSMPQSWTFSWESGLSSSGSRFKGSTDWMARAIQQKEKYKHTLVGGLGKLCLIFDRTILFVFWGYQERILGL